MLKQIKGASPEMVEYIGMKNLINAVKESAGLRSGKLLFGFEGILLTLLQVEIAINTLATAKLQENLLFNLDKLN